MKVCPYCAEELADDVVACTQCGRDTTLEPGWAREPQPVLTPSPEQVVRSSEERAALPGGGGRPGVNRSAIVSFVMVMAVGILGTAAQFPPALAVAIFAVAVALGVKAMQETRVATTSERGFGFAGVAVVLAIVGILGYGRLLIT